MPSNFYYRKIYENQLIPKQFGYVENKISDSTIINTILPVSAETMEQLPNESVHLVVTSPPYNVGKEYDKDLTLKEYQDFIFTVMSETYRVLVSGGRICVNIANVGRRPYLPLHSLIIDSMIQIGFLMRGEIIWDKGAIASTAWGSWLSPSNPTLRDSHEYILVFCKDNFNRVNPFGRKSTISREDFLECTKGVWRFPTASSRKVGHPASFPLELPRRCIELYTYLGEIVLDPFMGSGTTALAAVETGRNFVGYETSLEYCNLANNRLGNYPLSF